MLNEVEILRRKLAIRAWRRGMREVDILLGKYADYYIDKMDYGQLAHFEKLLKENDKDLLDWLVGKKCPPTHFTEILYDISTVACQDNKAHQ